MYILAQPIPPSRLLRQWKDFFKNPTQTDLLYFATFNIIRAYLLNYSIGIAALEAENYVAYLLLTKPH